MSEDFIFDGFEPANTTPVPDVLFDQLLTELSGAELKVLLYIIRRTSGFKKETDAISLSQFTDGIITREGKVLDHGCGIKNRTQVTKALAKLETLGCIQSRKTYDPSGDKAVTTFGIRFMGSAKIVPPSTDSVPGVVRKSYHGSNEIVPGVVRKSYPQETVIQLDSLQETVIQDSSADADSARDFSSNQKEIDNDNHSQFSTTNGDKPSENGDKPQKPKRGRKGRDLTAIEPVPPPEKPAADALWNVVTCLQLADYYRGYTLTNGSYGMAQQEAISIIQRGRTYAEIDSVFRFMRCIDPDLRDDFWEDKTVDIWHVNKHCEAKLKEIERKTRNRAPSTSTNGTKPRPSVLVSEEQAAKNKARMYEIVAAKQAAAQAKKVAGVQS